MIVFVKWKLCTGQVLGEVDHLAIFPATHFVTNDDHMEVAIAKIQAELEEQLAIFEKEGKLLEAQRFETADRV